MHLLACLLLQKDGEQLAHEWSSGDKRYTEQETRERLDRATAAVRPGYVPTFP